MKVGDSMWEIYEKIIDSKGYTTADVSRGTGINQSTFSNWKRRQNLITGANAKKIAAFLGVSVDFLMTGKEPERSYNYEISDFEYELILAFRKADMIDQTSILRILGLEKRERLSESEAG